MPITFYMDHHVPRAITLGLRLREADVITAYEDGTSELDDTGLLDRAGELGRVLFTRDDDLSLRRQVDKERAFRFTASCILTNSECRSASAWRIWNSSPRSERPPN